MHRKIGIGLADIAVLESEDGHRVPCDYTCNGILYGIEVPVEMKKPARSPENLHVIEELPHSHVGRERCVAQVIVLGIDLLEDGRDGCPYHALKNGELRLYILAVGKDEHAAQETVVGIKTVSFRLHVGREPVIGYTVKTAHSRA